MYAPILYPAGEGFAGAIRAMVDVENWWREEYFRRLGLAGRL
jgi:hypothetical protein